MGNAIPPHLRTDVQEPGTRDELERIVAEIRSSIQTVPESTLDTIRALLLLGRLSIFVPNGMIDEELEQSLAAQMEQQLGREWQSIFWRATELLKALREGPQSGKTRRCVKYFDHSPY